jgi:protein SCO1/2
MTFNILREKGKTTVFTGLVITTLLALVLAGDIYAHEIKPVDPHAQHKMVALLAGEDGSQVQDELSAASTAKVAMAEIDLPDGLSMLNQFGNQVDLREDVIGNKIVVIDFVYTTCTTVCPVVSTILSMVKTRLIERMDKDIALITITVDPTRDTPHRLLSYSKNFNPGAGWSWLTGDKKTVDKALSAMGAYTPNFEDHPAMVLIGDDSKSEWYRFYGFPAPDAIESKLRELLSNRSS